MIGWNAHLNDDRLLECYLGERGIEPINFRAAEHLDECARCRDRYAALVDTMDELHVNAGVETDAVFTPERLDTQRQLIARRLAAINHAARVLAFPGQTQTSSSDVSGSDTFVTGAGAASGFGAAAGCTCAPGTPGA